MFGRPRSSMWQHAHSRATGACWLPIGDQVRGGVSAPLLRGARARRRWPLFFGITFISNHPKLEKTDRSHVFLKICHRKRVKILKCRFCYSCDKMLVWSCHMCLNFMLICQCFHDHDIFFSKKLFLFTLSADLPFWISFLEEEVVKIPYFRFREQCLHFQRGSLSYIWQEIQTQ